MSVRTGFAIVGTAIGAYFGNAQLGFAIGSMVGGYVDPVEVKGPRLTDAQTQTSQDGVPIPITYGSVRISGNIIATGTLQEHKKKDSGKGSGTETTTYYYTRTYAIGICEGPIQGVRRIWRDGKLVYDARPPTDFNMDARVAAAKYAQKMDLYLGDETQTPNSALQAIFGAENVPANRGLAYVVIRDEDLTDRGGSIPQLEFEVVQLATSYDVGTYDAQKYHTPLWSPFAASLTDPRSTNTYQYAAVPTQADIDSALWTTDLGAAVAAVAAANGLTKLGQMMGWAYTYHYNNGAQYDSAPFFPIAAPTNARVLGFVYTSTDFLNITVNGIDAALLTREMCNGGLYSPKTSNGDGAHHYSNGVITNTRLPTSNPDAIFNILAEPFYISPDVVVGARVTPNCIIFADLTWLPIPDSPGFYVAPDGTIHQVGECQTVTGSFHQLQARQLDISHQYIQKYPVGPAAAVGSPDDNETFWESAYAQAVFLGEMPPGLVYGTGYPVGVTTACYCNLNTAVVPEDPLLSFIVADLCERKGLLGEDIDVSQLIDRVKGFTIATATSAADAINALAPAFQFDGAEFDGRTRFIKRGGPTLAALNEQDAFDSEDGRIVETRSQELELPRKMALAYMDIDADYAVTTQQAERLSASVASSGVDTVQLSVVMDHTKAAQTVDILLKDQWSSVNGTLALSVGDEYSDLVPTDVLFLSYEEALFRARVVEAENADGVVKLQLQQDTALAYSSIAVGVPPRPSEEGGTTITGPTFLEVMNLPALRDQDDQVGIYVAGNSPVGRWPGAQIAVSSDGGLTWVDVSQITQPATMGNLEVGMNDWTPDIVDSLHSFEVFLPIGEFDSITEEQLFNGGNPLCIGNEIVQFETATLVDTQLYKCDGLVVRGRRNTSPQPWPTGTRAVSLEDVYFIPLDRTYIGRTLQFRATTLGTDVQYGTIKSLDFTTPRSAQEWNVTNVHATRDASHTASLSWSPRHRLGTSLSPYPSKYFTGYQVVISDGTSSKTYLTTAQSFTYTDAQAAADFGSSPSTLSFTLAATNNILGAGQTVEVIV